MGDAGIVADEEGAGAEAGGKFGKRERTGEFARSRLGEAFKAALFCFAADKKQARAGKLLNQFAPFWFWPVLLFAAAARVKSQLEFALRYVLDRQTWNRISIEDRKTRERLKKNFSRVDAISFIRPMGAGNELRFGNLSDVRLKDAVRIVQIRDDDRKGAEEISKGRIELAAPRKEARHRTRVDRMHGVHQVARAGELRDVRITEKVEAGVGKLGSESRKDRKRQDKIADRSTTDDQDFVLRNRHLPGRLAGHLDGLRRIERGGLCFHRAEHGEAQQKNEHTKGDPRASKKANAVFARRKPVR